MIISVNGREKKIAILDNGRVTEFYIERGEENTGIAGNIYKGRVQRVLPGMQSAFVEIGLERAAFLHVVDIWSRGEQPIEKILAEGQPVLAADTTVALDGRIYGKPENRPEAEEILAALAGKRHEVLTAVALKNQDWIEVALSTSEVTLKALSKDDIAQYVASGEGDDKAGAYGIQGRAARFVVEIRGSYSGIMGLPLYETGQLIDRLPYRSR